jgi:hypothetical protein
LYRSLGEIDALRKDLAGSSNLLGEYDMSNVLLTLYDGDVIVAKRFGYLSGELMGIRALCDDGTFNLFAVKSNPTNAEFHDIQIAADATYDEKKRAVEEATGWKSEDEFPWLDGETGNDGETSLWTGLTSG